MSLHFLTGCLGLVGVVVYGLDFNSAASDALNSEESVAAMFGWAYWLTAGGALALVFLGIVGIACATGQRKLK